MENNLTELPDKWCINVKERNIFDIVNKHFKTSYIFCGYGYVNNNSRWLLDYKVINYCEINLDQFKKWVLKLHPVVIPKEEIKFEVGKWYKNLSNSNTKYIKYIGILDYGYFNCSQSIGRNNEYYSFGGTFGVNNRNSLEEVNLSEIQQYLPDSHVDKISKKVNMEEMLAYAYKHYTLGVIFESFENNNSIRRIKYYPGENTITWYIHDNVIRSENGVGTDGVYCSNPSVYKDGKWAKIISSPINLKVENEVISFTFTNTKSNCLTINKEHTMPGFVPIWPRDGTYLNIEDQKEEEPIIVKKIKSIIII